MTFSQVHAATVLRNRLAEAALKRLAKLAAGGR